MRDIAAALSPCMEKPEAVVYTRDSILLPNLYQLPTNPFSYQKAIDCISIEIHVTV